MVQHSDAATANTIAIITCQNHRVWVRLFPNRAKGSAAWYLYGRFRGSECRRDYETAGTCKAADIHNISITNKHQKPIPENTHSASMLSAQPRLFVHALANYAKHFWSIFVKTCRITLLWKRPIKFWGWSYRKLPSNSHFEFLLKHTYVKSNWEKKLLFSVPHGRCLLYQAMPTYTCI